MKNNLLPTIKFGQYYITRLIIGGNPLRGCSHISREKDTEMKEYFTDENVLKTLKKCEQSGINAIQARGDYIVMNWIELHRRQGGFLHWIAQTASEMHDVFQNIRVISASGAITIYHHGTKTDRLWNERKIDSVKEYLKSIRDTGLLVGLGTHIPEVVQYAEEKNWDVDFYMTCIYNLSRTPRESSIVSGVSGYEQEKFIDSNREKMLETIRKTNKTCLTFKILGAGRKCESQREVESTFQYIFNNIKPTDAIVVGMFPKYSDQIQLNAASVRKILGEK